MSSPAEALRALWPALAFLLAAVPLASMLDDLGFFDAAAGLVAARTTSVLGLWLLAAATTVVLNLDTTVVLLTPLYLRLARWVDVDPLPVVAIPLLLASLASSVLPVSNLTTLIAADTLGLGVADVVTHLALPGLAAVAVGWLAYRRRFPTHLPTLLPTGPDRVEIGGQGGRVTATDDRRALRIGGALVAGVLVGFTLGPTFGVPAWVVALVADAVLVIVTRRAPWRRVPVATALGIAALGLVVAAAVPPGRLDHLLSHQAPLALVAITGIAASAANLVNNLPALLVALGDGGSATGAGWGQWAWLLGVNVGAVLLPLGAIANLLWWRILRTEGVTIGLRRYVSITVPVAAPAVAAAAATLALERLVTLRS
ncbi:MAG: SLC13 family permease [Acidimicrobiales bacterium]